MFGRIIIFEGPDGVGKTTLVNHIKNKYKIMAYSKYAFSY